MPYVKAGVEFGQDYLQVLGRDGQHGDADIAAVAPPMGSLMLFGLFPAIQEFFGIIDGNGKGDTWKYSTKNIEFSEEKYIEPLLHTVGVFKSTPVYKTWTLLHNATLTYPKKEIAVTFRSNLSSMS